MATLLLLSTAYSLHPLSHRAPRARCCRADTLCSSAASLPPPLRDADAFARGVLDCDATAWWRQDSQRLQILVPLADGVSFKRDVSVDVSRRRLTLRVADSDVAVGELWHEVNVDASDWFVDDAPDFGDARFLVVELQKRESFVDWAAPLKPAGGGSGEEGRRSLIIGGKGEAQKQAPTRNIALSFFFPHPRLASFSLPGDGGATRLVPAPAEATQRSAGRRVRARGGQQRDALLSRKGHRRGDRRGARPNGAGGEMLAERWPRCSRDAAGI